MEALRAESRTSRHQAINVRSVQLGLLQPAFLNAGNRIKTQKSMDVYLPLMGTQGRLFDGLDGTQDGSPALAEKALMEILSGTERAMGREMPKYLELGADVRVVTLQAHVSIFKIQSTVSHDL